MIKEQITKAIAAAYNGEESCAEVYALLKEIITIAESGLKVVEPGAMAEARDFNKGEKYYGGLWEFRNTATYLDFDKDELVKTYSESLSERKKALNEAWKAAQSGKGFFDSNTGEEIPVLPVKTPAREILIYKSKS